MSKRFAVFAKAAFALGVIGGVFWGAYALIRLWLGWLTSLRSELATAIIAAATAVLVSVLSAGVGKYLERRESIARATRLKKVPVYEKLISFIFGVLQQGKPGIAKMTEDKLIPEYTTLTENVIVWGSDSVLKKFGEFRVASLRISKQHGTVNALATLEDVMLAIRIDLGYRNTMIRRGDLLRLFINDLDEHHEALKLLKR